MEKICTTCGENFNAKDNDEIYCPKCENEIFGEVAKEEN